MNIDAGRVVVIEKDYVQQKIEASPTKFYYHVPFVLSDDSCVAFDFKTEEDALARLKKCVTSGKFDLQWIQRHSI